eukprot:TRINITY_DN3762_c0_g2_i1.p1 TRINITY_DN3762_c0_g2~~TRINITY_DN3762_c0_g2_i1.p1  ORF type:complete len:711 (-),score=147.03 TRINITY_DN3762_c0_g2_i1:254-2386(-)
MSVTNEFIHDVFLARCKDLGERLSPEEAEAFLKAMIDRCRDRTVNLRASFLGINASVSIAGGLRTVDVEKLDLYGNQIRDVGAMAILQLCHQNPRIRFLNLGCNDIAYDGATAVAHELQSNTSLVWLEMGAEPEHWTDNCIGADGTIVLCKALKTNPSLRYLGLNRNQVGKSKTGPPALASLLLADTPLAALRLGNNILGPRGCTTIAESLWGNHHLTHLFINGNDMGAEGAEAFGAMLRSNSTLVVLSLEDNNIGTRGLDAIADVLTENRTLTVLNVAGNEIADAGAELLARALLRNNTLTHLNAEDNNIGEKGGVALANVLARSQVMSSLSLGRNPLRSATALAFADVLGINQSLITLTLDTAKIADDGALAIAKSLAHNTTLVTLRMRDNFLSEECGKKMGEIMEENTHLHVVDLRGNRISHMQLTTFTRLAQRNKSQAAAVVPNRLKARIIHLKGQQDKLRDTEAALAQETEARMVAQKKVTSLEGEIAATRADEKEASQRLTQQLYDEKRLYEDAAVRLEARKREIELVKAEYEKKFVELQAEVDIESKRRDHVQSLVDERMKELTDVQQEIPGRLRDIAEKIAAVRDKRAELKERTAMARQELAEYQAGKPLISQRSSGSSPAVKPATTIRSGSTADGARVTLTAPVSIRSSVSGSANSAGRPTTAGDVIKRPVPIGIRRSSMTPEALRRASISPGSAAPTRYK